MTVKEFLDSRARGLVISSEFARKQGFKNTVEVNIFYKGHRKRMEINVIGGQK